MDQISETQDQVQNLINMTKTLTEKTDSNAMVVEDRLKVLDSRTYHIHERLRDSVNIHERNERWISGSRSSSVALYQSNSRGSGSRRSSSRESSPYLKHTVQRRRPPGFSSSADRPSSSQMSFSNMETSTPRPEQLHQGQGPVGQLTPQRQQHQEGTHTNPTSWINLWHLIPYMSIERSSY